MHLLDTDTLTLLFGGHARVTQRLEECEDSLVCTSIITRIEMLRGRFEFLLKAANRAELLRAQEWLVRTEAELRRLPIMPMDEKAADLFEHLRANRKLKNIGRADLLIASIALANGAMLVTRNTRDFALVPGLKLVNWAD